jgi:YebC/PmpR family DNA-binding regulatory protein
MAGHNKWSKVKNFKGKIDAARARVFSRYSKEIAVAAKTAGGDPNFNPRLRSAILSAKAENMPNDNIERAIKKGTGELEGVNYEESTYEGYGPGGVAFIIEVLTDNKNRAAADIRKIFSQNGGNLATPGSVSYLFQRRGLIVIPKSQISEDDLLALVLEAGADDIRSDEENHEIITPVDTFLSVVEVLKSKKLEPSNARLTYLPQTQTAVNDETTAKKVLQLVEELDENDDVQHVHANFEIPDAILEKV